MVDPTSDLGTDVDPADAPECAVCGDRIADAPERRVETWIEDGRVRRRHFCSDRCFAERS